MSEELVSREDAKKDEVKTISELQAMSDSKLKIELIYLFGNKFIRSKVDTNPPCRWVIAPKFDDEWDEYWEVVNMHKKVPDINLAKEMERFPNWPTDIRAAFELEGCVPEDMLYAYIEILKQVILREVGDDQPDWLLSWFMTHATARQKSIAYVLLMEGSK